MTKKELRNLGGKPVGRLGLGGRTKKLMRPHCVECQGHPDVSQDWWRTCPHEPYFTQRERPVRKPIIEQAEDGRKLITGYEEEIVYDELPNISQVQVGNPRISSGAAEPYQRGVRGWKDPEEFGIAPFCQYKNCWNQTGLKEYKTGTFCREGEAKMVAVDIRKGVKALEVLLEDKRAEQLDSVSV